MELVKRRLYTMTNEFEEMEHHSVAFDDVKDEQEQNNEEMIDEGSQGQEYDISKAPKSAKGPERENLDNKEVTITDMKLILPPKDSPWKTSKDGKTKYKQCIFVLFYDNEGQREYYSGVKVFDRSKDGIVQYSHPSIQPNVSTQASNLLKKYAEYKGKTSEEISLHEFFNFLKSKPKALVKQKGFEYDGKTTNKNIVEKFI